MLHRKQISRLTLIVTFVVWFAALHLTAQDKPQAPDPRSTPTEEIDFDKARSLLQKRQRGEKLAEQEAAYLDRAMAERRRREQGLAIVPRDRTGWKPINEMSNTDRYKDQEGGLYGQGQNNPPDALRKRAEEALAMIRPLDRFGMPSSQGTIGFISISMSNATQEFSMFKQFADRDQRKSSQVTIVDCAQGGQAMAEWVPPRGRPWEVLEQRLNAAGITPAQVQTVWLKIANKGPRGELNEHGKQLQKDSLAVIHNAASRFPNLKVVYLSSRIYGGYASGALNPEPYAYESGFVARWLIRDQFTDSNESSIVRTQGTKTFPVLLWGPYLWADGNVPRASDGLSYSRKDLAEDGTHPSPLGREKVAKAMLEFFVNNPWTKSWFQGN